MKNIFTLVAALLFWAVLLSACSSSRNFPGSQPVPSPYPQPRPVPPVVVVDGSSLPPGQAKKIYGEKSAKRFAKMHKKHKHCNVAYVISPYAGFPISRTVDGRYFHQRTDGVVYWQGNDGNYYLDESTYGSHTCYKKQKHKKHKHDDDDDWDD
jgi:hypothetical protein